MEGNNRLIYRVIAVIMAVTLTVCAFSSCGNNTGDDNEITRGSEVIEKPTDSSGEITTEAVTDENGETTTLGIIIGLPEITANNAIATTSASGSGSGSGGAGSILDAATLAAFVSGMGFEYDTSEGVFYTGLDNWQRSANYVSHYDTFAQFGNMRYRTAKADIKNYDGLDWRIQMWKGQYGVFGGCEIGVYTKNPDTNEMLYNCADNDHLLYMESALYLNKADYESGSVFFKRPWQAHWWLTGFKSGVVDPANLVMTMRIRTKSNTMANAFEASLVSVGFQKGDAQTQYDTYRRSLNDFYILWYNVGELNYINNSAS